MMGDMKELKLVTTNRHRPVGTLALISWGPQSQKRNTLWPNRSEDQVWCSHCNRIGHTRERYFKLHGYPGNTKNQKDNKALLSSNTSSSAATETVLDVRLTKSQLETLHKILGTSSAHRSLAIEGTALNITSDSSN
ncbi:hypothetical protein HRI_003340600 [Hibiscus trionum]|uniref:Uncharacterized protein n=1 Tax=Hibiscus trionum TaxID=183268 RepID=A0A9W7IMC3_HIBTR|nr:hypothetical protein HRI_003340600 [Hibiscus trionum]